MNAGPSQELKIVFTGPMGAGKTTAIAAISEVAPVFTEVDNTDLLSHEKKSTTVGFDFGRITLADGHVIRLFGTPGQERFRFMWEIIGRGAAGVIVLLDASQADALAQLDLFVDTFLPLVPCGALVIGVGRTGQAGALTSDTFADHLDSRGISAPVLSVDARDTKDVIILVQVLACTLDARTKMVANG